MNAQVALEEARSNLAKAEADVQKEWRARHDEILEELCILGRKLAEQEKQLASEFAEAEAKCVVWGGKLTAANNAIYDLPALPEFALKKDIAAQQATQALRVKERDSLLASEERKSDVATRDRLQRELDEVRVNLAILRSKEQSQRNFIANNYRIGDGSGVFRVAI